MRQWARALRGIVPVIGIVLAGGMAEARIKVDPACASDAAKLCREAQETATWDLTVFDCLADKQERLTKDCRAYVEKRTACELDVGKYCDGRIFADTRECLARNANNLTQSCRTQLGWTPGTERGQAQASPSDTNYGECSCLNETPPEAIQAQCLAAW